MGAPPTTFVVSDLHIGSRYFPCSEFLAWLDALPSESELILNGDVLDNLRRPLTGQHQAVLDRLIRESDRRSLVWIYGNHDNGLVLRESGRIRFARRWELGDRLLIFHGDRLDDMLPRFRLLKPLVELLYRQSIRFGRHDVHVAQYAKGWPILYHIFNRRIARKALRMARALGFEAVTCGHTHAALELERDGIRYLNTGAWTEPPLYYLEVEGERVSLRMFRNGDSGLPVNG